MKRPFGTGITPERGLTNHWLLTTYCHPSIFGHLFRGFVPPFLPHRLGGPRLSVEVTWSRWQLPVCEGSPGLDTSNLEINRWNLQPSPMKRKENDLFTKPPCGIMFQLLIFKGVSFLKETVPQLNGGIIQWEKNSVDIFVNRSFFPIFVEGESKSMQEFMVIFEGFPTEKRVQVFGSMLSRDISAESPGNRTLHPISCKVLCISKGWFAGFLKQQQLVPWKITLGRYTFSLTCHFCSCKLAVFGFRGTVLHLYTWKEWNGTFMSSWRQEKRDEHVTFKRW